MEDQKEKWRHASIASKAEWLWKSKGRPQGMDEQIWLEAERLVKDGEEAAAHHGPGGDW